MGEKEREVESEGGGSGREREREGGEEGEGRAHMNETHQTRSDNGSGGIPRLFIEPN